MSGDEAPDRPGFRKFEDFLDAWSRRDFLKRMGGAAAYAAFLAGGTEFLDACANAGQGSSNGPSVTQNAKKGGHAIEGSISDISHLNPVLISDTASGEVASMVYDGLISVRANGEPVANLAKDLPKTSSDGLTYTFTLKDNLKFSDGSPLTADDVKFTYDLMFDPAYKEVNSPRRGDFEEYVQSITAKDAKTVVFQMKKVFAPFLVLHGAYGILPKKLWSGLAPKEINTSPMDQQPTVVSGQYKVQKWDKGSQVTLVRNDQYWGAPSYLDSFIYKVVPDSVALVNQMKTGELDLGTIDPSQLANIQSDTDVSIVNFPVPTFTFYAYNQSPSVAVSKFFSDKNVRQALLYALNRQQMVTAIYFSQAVVANSPIPPVSWAYDPNTKPVYNFDVAKANKMLDDAGYKKGSDGIRVSPSGQRLAFTMITNAGNKQRESSLVTMQDQWKAIGVDATPKLITFPALVSQITNERSYDVFLVGFNFGADPDESQLWHSRNTKPGGFNGFNYKSSKVDSLLDQAAGTLDQSKRKQLYAQFQSALMDDCPAPILVFNKGIWGFNKRVQGYNDKDLGIGAYNQYGASWRKTLWVQDQK